MTNSEKWYQRSWRPAMAGLYLLLLLIDYAIRPAVNYWEYQKFELVTTVSAITELEPTVQIQLIQTLREGQAIPPILTEFVHLAFGTILGAAAYTRGREKIERLRSNSRETTNTNNEQYVDLSDLSQG